MRSEIAALGAGIAGIALGFGMGWEAHKPPPALLPTPPPLASHVKEPDTPLPDYPKPPLDEPVPVADLATAAPPALGGDLPNLPLPGANGSGPIGGEAGPIAPSLPNGAPPPAADLNADEARVRRIVLGSGAQVVSAADARDDAGSIGRTIVAETTPEGLVALRNALRRALGARAVLSDAGVGAAGDDPGLKKLEDDLAVARKRRDKDRIDFLPQSPILQDSERAVLDLERTVAERRKASSRVRLNVLIRPTL